VFIVNIGKGSGGNHGDIRVSPAPFLGDDEEDGEPTVSISDHESAVDQDEDARDHEETKRLLYVALTRARDRLYLAGTIANGKLVLQRGSIGKVLPPSLPALMAASGDVTEVPWTGAASTHVLRRVPPAGATPLAWRPSTLARTRLNDHGPIVADVARQRVETGEFGGAGDAQDVQYSRLESDGRIVRGRLFRENAHESS
jgi:hypothetical protein